jgi:hypothetical protein
VDKNIKKNLFLKKYNRIIFQKKNLLKNMSWSKGHSSLEEKIFKKPVIDSCINCGDHEQVQATITMEFGEGNLNSGPICRKCYSIHKGPRIAQF